MRTLTAEIRAGRLVRDGPTSMPDGTVVDVVVAETMTISMTRSAPRSTDPLLGAVSLFRAARSPRLRPPAYFEPPQR